jgi:hypothetical protein
MPDPSPRRLRGLFAHMFCYAVAAGIVVTVNRAVDPEHAWAVWLIVGWLGVLALHVAYVMGLFGRGGRTP